MVVMVPRLSIPLSLSLTFFVIEADDDTEKRSDSRNPVHEGPLRTVTVVRVNEEWGVATHLGGLLSSVTLFSDVIPASTIKTIYHYGERRINIKPRNCRHLLGRLLFLLTRLRRRVPLLPVNVTNNAGMPCDCCSMVFSIYAIRRQCTRTLLSILCRLCCIYT